MDNRTKPIIAFDHIESRIDNQSNSALSNNKETFGYTKIDQNKQKNNINIGKNINNNMLDIPNQLN